MLHVSEHKAGILETRGYGQRRKTSPVLDAAKTLLLRGRDEPTVNH
jgi:hypothetical protein